MAGLLFQVKDSRKDITAVVELLQFLNDMFIIIKFIIKSMTTINDDPRLSALIKDG